MMDENQSIIAMNVILSARKLGQTAAEYNTLLLDKPTPIQ
jgi:hypothetical protein